MTLLRPLAIGIATGARTTMGLAAVSRGCRETNSFQRAGQPRAALTSTWGQRNAAFALLGELVADKLPKTPSRLEPPGLAGRLVAATMCALALADRDRQPVLPSVAFALGGTAIGALGGSALRKTAKTREIPNLPVALGEDAVAAGLAFLAVHPW